MALTIAQIVFDCVDAAKLAAFWSEVLDRPVDPEASAEFATIGKGEASGGNAPALMFIQVPEPKQTKNRLHLDVSIRDVDNWRDEVNRLTNLGAAEVKEYQEYGWHWVTMRDPEGNEFDIGIGEA